MINKVILVGNLGRTPEFKAFENGGGVATFTLATSKSYKNKEGTWVENTEWHDCVAFGPIAERVCKNLERGNTVYLEGSITSKLWKKDGEETNRKQVEIKIFNYRKIKGKESLAMAGEREANTLGGENADDPNNSSSSFNDDLPF